jgi:hypothetical protein
MLRSVLVDAMRLQTEKLRIAPNADDEPDQVRDLAPGRRAVARLRRAADGEDRDTA